MRLQRLAWGLLFAFISATASAQVEGQDTSPTRSELQPVLFEQSLMLDSSRINTAVPFPELQKPPYPVSPSAYSHTSNFTLPMTTSPELFRLWNGANVIVEGDNYQLLGLMDVAIGSVSFHHDFGRLHFAASAIANKYRMPMQNNTVSVVLSVTN